MFKLDLVDTFGGEILAMLFNNQPDSLGNFIEEDRFYFISNAKVNDKDPIYDQSPHQYKLVFHADSIICPVYVEDK